MGKKGERFAKFLEFVIEVAEQLESKQPPKSSPGNPSTPAAPGSAAGAATGAGGIPPLSQGWPAPGSQAPSTVSSLGALASPVPLGSGGSFAGLAGILPGSGNVGAHPPGWLGTSGVGGARSPMQSQLQQNLLSLARSKLHPLLTAPQVDVGDLKAVMTAGERRRDGVRRMIARGEITGAHALIVEHEAQSIDVELVALHSVAMSRRPYAGDLSRDDERVDAALRAALTKYYSSGA